ncbi:MAG: hypothetical protein ACYDB6_02940 [Candidatus Limnocylindrales bacterium]
MTIRAELPPAVVELVEDRHRHHIPVTGRDLVGLWATEAATLGLASRGPVDVAEAAARLALDPMRPLTRPHVAALFGELERAGRQRTPQWTVGVGPDGSVTLTANLAGRLDNYREALRAFRARSRRQRRVTVAADRARGLTVDEVAHRWGVSSRSVEAWSQETERR